MSPTASLRQQILAAVVTRLSVITQASGDYFTDAGATLFAGEAPQLGQDDPAHALAVLLVDDEPRLAGPAYLVTGTLEIHAVANPTLDDSWMVVEQLLADIKRAMELPDRRLGGLLHADMERGPARALPRQEGSLTVGATMTYTLPWKEGWGLP